MIWLFAPIGISALIIFHKVFQKVSDLAKTLILINVFTKLRGYALSGALIVQFQHIYHQWQGLVLRLFGY